GIFDAAGNFLSDADDEIALALAEGPEGGSLSGASAPVPAVGGIATFSDLQLDKVGGDYVLVATRDGLQEARSQSIEVVTSGPPVRLSFLAQPQSVAADEKLPPVRVEVLDAAGNRVRDLPQTVFLVLEAHPDGGSLGGDLQRETV